MESAKNRHIFADGRDVEPRLQTRQLPNIRTRGREERAVPRKRFRHLVANIDQHILLLAQHLRAKRVSEAPAVVATQQFVVRNAAGALAQVLPATGALQQRP